MKSYKIQLFCLSAIVLGVIAWAPPNNEDLVMGSNTVTSPYGFVGVIGSGNKVNTDSSLVIGENNKVSHNGTTATSPQAWRVLVAGDGNNLNNGNVNTIVGGYNNTVSAHHSLVIGGTNTVGGPTVGSLTYHSAAIGAGNLLNTAYGWTIGLNNKVSGSVGVAIGNANEAHASDSAAIGTWNIINSNAQYSYALGGGLRVNQPGAVALGSWNAPMVAGDIMVLGCGNVTTPATSLRATADGSIILGSPTSGKVVLAKAQGDISMGAYQ